MQRCLLVLIFMFLGVPTLFAQGKKEISDLDFLNHVVGTDNKQETVFLLEKIIEDFDEGELKDSLLFLNGYINYELKNRGLSSASYLRVSEKSKFRFRSVLMASSNHMLDGNYSKAVSLLDLVHPTDSLSIALIDFQRCGYDLLLGDLDAYQQRKQVLSQNYYPFAEEEKNLEKYHTVLARSNKKSPFVAGALSALVPGLGKVYSGKIYGGVAAFIFVTAFAGMTVETYYRLGPKDVQPYIFGSLATLFYTGNILGSIYSVGIKKQEVRNEVHRSIVVDLHIPLRRLYGM